ncbi:MAG: hypothetical protein MK066_00425 [Crocinitomicaceae bacterium]|nr:hypothetical protein [Crocinitomicaceae bacterium]
MSKYRLYILITLLTSGLFAQNDFRFRNLAINDGLSQSSVTCILQDEVNALWVGTQDGLNRYDGVEFEVFMPDEVEGLESGYIKCGIIDKEESIWFGTNNGLVNYDPKTELFQTFFVKKGSALQIEDICLGANNDLWVATTENGLYRFDCKTKKFETFKKLIPSKKTTNVLLVEDRTLIVSTEDKGLFICDLISRKIQEVTIGFLVNDIILSVEGELVIATNKGLFEFDPSTKTRTQKFVDEVGEIDVNSAYYDSETGWLVATRTQGVFVIFDSGEYHQYTENIFQKTSLLNNEVNSILKDNSGSLWLGSQRGLSNFDPANKGFLGVEASGNDYAGIPAADVWSFAESKTGAFLYIGTSKGVSRHNSETGRFRQFYRTSKERRASKEETTVLSIEAVSDELLLVACTDGLFELHITDELYEFKKVDFEAQEVKKGHDRVYSIVHIKDHRYLIATRGGALHYDLKTKRIEVFEHDPFNSKKTISKGVCRLAFKDLEGKIWLSTSIGGLNVYSEREGERIIKPYEYNYLIRTKTNDYITSIYQSKSGEYWMGTLGSGLINWDTKTNKKKVFNKSNGLPNDVIYGVLSDEKGTYWLSTNKGLCAFSPSKKTARNYTEVHGLTSNEFNLGAYFRGASGMLYFGGIYGYNYFDPLQMNPSQKDVEVVFTKFKLDNEWLKPNEEGSPLTAPVFLTKAINLSYVNRSFSLKFQTSNLTNANLVNYKYLLEGSDEGEILLGTNNEIHFNSLSPGNYVLKVYARIGDRDWCANPASMSIVVAPPFWQTWWFWAIIIFFLVIGIRLFIRQRIEASRREKVRLEMRIRERTREIHDQSKKIEQQKRKIEKEKIRVEEQKQLLQIEKDKTEKLLKNVMPASTAEELKKRGKARARAYKTVSVLFTDFVGFTKVSERMNPTELVKKLDVYFTKFDEIIVKNNLEKIKTIGDAYMCAGGVPVRNKTNPIDTCLAALQIQDYMQKRKNDAIANGREYWELRLGINTGEVTAGVIGSERLAYDIWGSTVNQAQRMEMMGEPGKVTVTGATFELIEPYFECSFRGKAQSKSKGLIDMYVVERIKPELSIREEGIIPNERFKQVVNLHFYSSINYYKAERHIMRVLDQRLSKKLYYHSISHTKDVVAAIEHLALLENVTDEGLFLLKSAATYHDAGFVEQYDSNEPIGARLAEEILPKYGYTAKHIDKIKELIYVTQIPHKPKNHLEEIMCDADLDYLGRNDFHEIADRLRRELREHGKINSDRKWDEIQVSFLKMHKYFTKTSIKTRKKKKMENLKEVEERLKMNNYID